MIAYVKRSQVCQGRGYMSQGEWVCWALVGCLLIGRVRGGTGTHKACDIFDTLLSGNIWILTVVQNMHLRWHPLKATCFLVIKMFFFISITQCSLVQLGAFAIQIIWNEKYIANILYMSAITHLPKIFLLLELPWWRHQMEIFPRNWLFFKSCLCYIPVNDKYSTSEIKTGFCWIILILEHHIPRLLFICVK